MKKSSIRRYAKSTIRFAIHQLLAPKDFQEMSSDIFLFANLISKRWPQRVKQPQFDCVGKYWLSTAEAKVKRNACGMNCLTLPRSSAFPVAQSLAKVSQNCATNLSCSMTLPISRRGLKLKNFRSIVLTKSQLFFPAASPCHVRPS